MQRRKLLASLAGVIALIAPACGYADNGSYQATGGSFSTGSAVGQSISVQGMPLTGTTATLSFTCPIKSYAGGTYLLSWTCAGGSVTIASTDNSLILSGTFTSGSMSFSGGGGGRGGHVTYWYQFNGAISGVIKSGGVKQQVNGSIAQSVKTTSQIGSGSAPVTAASLGWNSAYSPVVVADVTNSRLLGADNIAGANLVTYGSQGSGADQFESIAGLAEDKSKNIYITDSVLDRLVRIDDLTGSGWVALGGSGAGAKQFSAPRGVTIDSAGKIWIADAGNNRIVRFDDMTGKNWTAFGTLGSGAKQFSGPNSIAFDAQGRIYVTDPGNSRLVRFDDLTGTNWTALTMVNIDPYGYPISSPVGVTVRPSGLIEVVLGDGYMLGFTDMTGAGGSASYWGSTLTGMSVDAAGTLYVTGNFSPGLAQVVNASGAGYFASALGGVQFGPGPVLAAVTTSPTPAAPLLSTAALAFTSRNVGEPGSAQKVTVTNLGSATLPLSSITASPDFPLTDGCPASLGGGASCSLALRFDPTSTGARTGTLAVESTSIHPLLSVELTGTGTAPTAIVLPQALVFQPQQKGIASGSRTVTLANTGTGPLTIASIAAGGDFTETSNCPKVVAPGNGCTIGVNVTPSVTGALSGSLTISDDAIPTGTQQVVTLQGTGLAAAPALTLTAESLYFPDQKTGTVSPAQTVTLTNHSATKVALAAATYPAGFKGTTSCGTALNAGASCAFKIQFAPSAVGPVSGAITIPVTGSASLCLGISGTGVPANYASALTFNPAILNFGALQTGDNAAMSFGITNTSGLPTGLQAIALSGSGAFTITGNNCPTMLAGGKSCSVQVTFQPIVTATYSGNIKVTQSSGAATNVPLEGSATVNGS